ncbi:nuclear transport factor 2 family protein [Acidisarcina polymorpha]|nr:nuclear transport factor 2 family protein [Acidisarcina polymorpha]
MQSRVRILLFLLAGLAPAASTIRAQQAADQETAKTPTQIEVMQHLEDSWSAALAKRDQYGLEMVLSPQFVDISANGDVRSRNQEIAYVLNHFPDLISLEQTVVSVRMLGDVALVNGTYVLRRRANGHPVDEKGVFSHVFQRNRSNWQCINAQRTIVVEQALDKKAAATTTKQSKAELPFHIPLFHKGDEPASPPPASSDQSTAKPNPQ